jgi:hypothetical protein
VYIFGAISGQLQMRLSTDQWEGVQLQHFPALDTGAFSWPLPNTQVAEGRRFKCLRDLSVYFCIAPLASRHSVINKTDRRTGEAGGSTDSWTERLAGMQIDQAGGCSLKMLPQVIVIRSGQLSLTSSHCLFAEGGFQPGEQPQECVLHYTCSLETCGVLPVYHGHRRGGAFTPECGTRSTFARNSPSAWPRVSRCGAPQKVAFYLESNNAIYLCDFAPPDSAVEASPLTVSGLHDDIPFNARGHWSTFYEQGQGGISAVYR